MLRTTSAPDVVEAADWIADQVEPRYRRGPRSYRCGGHVAKLWQAAWDGACIALGGTPGDYRGLPARAPSERRVIEVTHPDDIALLEDASGMP